MKSFSNFLNKTALFIASTSFLVMTIVIFIQIISRYVLNNSLSWTEELSRYLFIWSIILGISIGVKTNILLSITIIKDNLPPKAKKVLELIIQFVILIFALIMTIYGWEIVGKVHNQLSPAMRVPMSYVYIVVPISGLIIVFHLITDWYETLVKRVRQC